MNKTNMNWWDLTNVLSVRDNFSGKVFNRTPEGLFTYVNDESDSSETFYREKFERITYPAYVVKQMVNSGEMEVLSTSQSLVSPIANAVKPEMVDIQETVEGTTTEDKYIDDILMEYHARYQKALDKNLTRVYNGEYMSTAEKIKMLKQKEGLELLNSIIRDINQ